LDGAAIEKTVYNTCLYRANIFENPLLKNHWARKVEIYMKAFRLSTVAGLFKSCPSRGERGGGLGLALIGETFYKNVFKISGTIGPEKLKFT
jgi:hypothetical protein